MACYEIESRQRTCAETASSESYLAGSTRVETEVKYDILRREVLTSRIR